MKVICIALILINLVVIQSKLLHTQSILKAGRVTLQADNNLYLTRCQNCAGTIVKSPVAVYQTTGTKPQVQWIIEKVGDKVAFKSDNGCYISRCNGCWKRASYPDGVFLNVCKDPKDNPWSLWTPEGQGNGKWAFKADNGKYLARCNGCAARATYPNFAFVSASNLQGSPWAIWNVNQVESKFPTGSVNIKSDINTYLSRCNGCAQGAYPNSAAAQEKNPNASNAIWKVQSVGDKVAFKSDNGLYLSRCSNCWPKASSPDGVFVHVQNLDGNPWALWTPQDLGNGKWAFKGDNGNYLSRCNGCVSSRTSVKQWVFVHVSTPPIPNNPWSQWTVTTR